jgi:cobalt/nickel transport system ATP-binding protein
VGENLVTAALHATDVTFAFPDGRQVLRGVSLRVEPGESVGVVGPNGAGKTTLFLSLIGIHRHAAGSLLVAGLDVAQKHNLREIRSRTGLVFQNSDDQLFSASVREDVAFGPLNLDLPPAEVQRRVTESLERVGATAHADRVSHHLSAGEKRRVALACVLAMEPELIVLDEPTNDLDPQARRELIDLLGDLPQTKLIGSHDLEFVLDTCSRVVVLDSGRIVADGPTRDILADEACMTAHHLEVPPSLRR